MATSQKSEQLFQKNQNPIDLIIYTAHETFLPLRHAPCLVFYTLSNCVDVQSEQPQTKTVCDLLTTEKSHLHPKITAYRNSAYVIEVYQFLSSSNFLMHIPVY